MNAKLLSRISAIVTFLFMLGSCDKADEVITAEDARDISEEASTDAYFQDLDDMAAVAVSSPSDEDFDNGRVSGTIDIMDHRFDCDGVVVTLDKDENSTQEHPAGVITVDFGSGCTDLRGNVRTGKVFFTYDGRRFQPGSSVVTSVENYTINDVKIEGVRTVTYLTASTLTKPQFHVVLENGKATFPDNTVAERESDLTMEWTRSLTPEENTLLIDEVSTANGTTRNGTQYSVTLEEDLLYKRFCGIAIDGIKQITLDGSREIFIDYGDGECDKTATITANGITRTITID